MEDFFQIGIITSTHGLQGEVKVYPTTDDVRRFRQLKEVILDRGRSVSGNGAKPVRTSDPGSESSHFGTVLEIEGVKISGQFAILKFKGVDSIEEAQKYRKASLLVPRENAVPLRKDEYFVADLIGLTVRGEDGAQIGVLNDVMETGANDVYVIALGSGKELLLPAIKQCVLEVNMEEKFIRIHILEGLLDESQ